MTIILAIHTVYLDQSYLFKKCRIFTKPVSLMSLWVKLQLLCP